MAGATVGGWKITLSGGILLKSEILIPLISGFWWE